MDIPHSIALAEEEHAARRVAEGGVLQRWALGLAAGARLALNPKDTQQVFLLAVAADFHTLPRLRDRLARLPAGQQLLSEQPAIDARAIADARLRDLPASTLGGAYVRMLDEQGLDADIFQRPPGLPDDLAYVAQRIRQTHDLWHLLTGLATDVPGEIALQAFSHAQLGQRVSWLITVFGTLFYGLVYRSTLPLARRWYRLGKQTPFLLAVPWEDLWQAPLADVRARFGLAVDPA